MFKKFRVILSKKQLGSFYFFIVLSFMSMILETLGVGLIIPFMQTLMSEEVNQYIINFFSYFKIYPTSKYNLIFILILILAFVYTFKAAFLTYVSYVQNKLIADTRVTLSNKLYDIYLNKPYSFHLNNNSSQLIRNIHEIDLVVFVLKCLIFLVNEVIVVVGISLFVIFYEPVGSLMLILFLGLFGYLFFKKVQIKATVWGEKRQTHQGLSLKYLQEGFGAIKDIIILQRSKELIKNFTENNKIIKISEFKHGFVDSLPRLWLEWLVVLGFVFLVLLMLFRGEELSYIVPLLGLFAAAAFRIMPSLARIMNSAQGILYNRPTVDVIYKEFYEKNFKNYIKTSSTKKILFTKEIALQDINFKYSESGPFILKNISLNIKNGTTVGFIGESGIGKTTLINIIMGLIEPTEGNLRVDDINIFENIQSWQGQIGYVPQNIYLTDDTIKRNIAFALPDEKINDIALKKAVTNAKLNGLIDSLNNGLDTKVGEFGDRISGGQKQRIAIARALYKDPSVLILDECTNSLDLKTEKKIIDEINSLKGKKTIIMITHRLSTLENCDCIYKVDEKGIKLDRN